MEPEPTYILIQCDMGIEPDVVAAIAEIPEVSEVRGTYGTFDIFCKVEAGRRETEKVLARIRRIPHIRSTNTLRSILSQGGR